MNLGQAIQEKGEKLGRARYELEQLEKKQSDLLEKSIEIDAESATDSELGVLDQLKTVNDDVEKRKVSIEKMAQQLEALRSHEQKEVSKKGEPAGGGGPAFHKTPKRKAKPGDQLVRLGVIKALSHMRRCSEEAVIEELYPDDFETKLIHGIQTKTAAKIATAVNTGRKEARSLTCSWIPPQSSPLHFWKVGKKCTGRENTPGTSQ